MSISNSERKMVLSGGIASGSFLDELFEAADTDTPQILFDGSACVAQNSLIKKRKTWRTIAEDLHIPEPIWLQDYTDDYLSRGKTNALLDKADILYVAGGASRKAITQWNDAGITQDIKQRVNSGDVVASGASAGAMIWFNTGLSDSNFYDVADGKHWDYEAVKEAAMFDSWVIAHHADQDNLGRNKQTLFADFLSQREGEWNYGIGIDTCAALVCIDGIAQVKDITPPSRRDKGFGANVYIYFDSLQEPRKLSDGDLIPLGRL